MLTADGGLAPSLHDPVINIVEGPATNCTLSPTCIASADSTGGGAPEVATYTNTTTAPKQLFVIVANGDDAPDLTFSLTVAIP